MTVHTWTSGQATVTYDDSTRTFSVTGGRMENYIRVDDTPWYAYTKQVEHIDIVDTTVYVGNYCFEGHTASSVYLDCLGIGDFSFDKNVTSCQVTVKCAYLGNSAFYQGNLNTVDIIIDSSRAEIPSYAGIGSEAFRRCTVDILSIHMPGDAGGISSRAFEDCNNLKNLTLSGEYSSIGFYVFQHCYNLTRINIKNRLNWDSISILSGAFALSSGTDPETYCNVYSPSNDANGRLD